MRALIPLLFLVSACSAVDRGQMSTFKPAPGGFEFTARTDNVSESLYNETDRIAWLEHYLRDNGLCPNGYEITSRQPVIVRASVGYQQIHYTGKCR